MVAALPEQEPIKPIDPVTATMPAEQSGIFLQLASFGTQNNAQSYSNKIKPQLGKLSEALHIFSKNGAFKVHLGPYRNQSEAVQIAENIRKNLDMTSFMVIR